MNITYKHRQEILKTQDGIHTKVAMILSDKVDWKSNSRVFPNKGFYTNWLIELAVEYNMGIVEFSEALGDLIEDGFFSARHGHRQKFILARTMPGGAA